MRALLTFEQAYGKGWAAASRSDDLDGSEDRFERRYGTDRAQWVAWMDGYMDRAAGRERWHMRDCRAAGGCDEHLFSAVSDA